MCTSYIFSIKTPVHILALQLFTRRVSSLNLTNAYLHHKCLVRKGKYQPGSKFEKNLDKIIEIISTNKFQQDDQIFKSYGKAPNWSPSYSSVAATLTGPSPALALLPRLPGFVGHARETKKLQYGTTNVTPDDFPSPNMIDYENTFSMQNPNNVSEDTKSFNKKAMDFLHKLVLKALIPDGIYVVDYAAGEERLGENKLYAMVQCAKITGKCKACLESAIKELSKCCGGKQGARVVLGISCNLRYELYPFLSK